MRSPARCVRAPLIVMVLLYLSSCVTSVTPLQSNEYLDSTQRNPTLLIFLPGIYDRAADFEREGLVQAVVERNMGADMIAVDVHYGYYARGTSAARLRADIVIPAKRQGYRDIWLVGISLGGLGALLYARTYPQDVTGLFLMAPLLGYSAESEDGDPAEWFVRRHGHAGLWEWLEDYPRQAARLPAVYLSYGEHDRFAEVNNRFAALLPPGHVETLAGTHDWETWKRLWNRALDRNFFGLSVISATPRASME